MISVLIPVYNSDIRSLVKALREEAAAYNFPIEIRCYDDGSTTHFKSLNAPICEALGVIYKELPLNLGRAKIRNKLAIDAVYDTLLFLDGDSLPSSENFIGIYFTHLQHPVVYGGLVYVKEKPDPNFYLRWHYGVERESATAMERNTKEYAAFKTCNFLIQKQLLLTTPFNEALLGYGHEDTLFGIRLQQQGIPVLHIDNPIYHLGLDASFAFLRKSEEAINNLYLLLQDEEIASYMKDFKLVKSYLWIKKFYLAPCFYFIYISTRPLLIRQLQSHKASLFLFDFFKLGQLFVVHFRSQSRKRN